MPQQCPWRMQITAVVLMLLLAVPAAAGQRQAEPLEDHWYVLLMGTKRIGWMHVWQTRQNDRITTGEKTQITMRRGTAAIKMTTESRFEETADGKPIKASNMQKLSAVPIETIMRFKEDHIEIVTVQAGQRGKPQRFANPRQKWLPPAAADRQVQAEIAKGAQKITVSTIVPAMGPKVIDATMTIQGRENVEVFGRTVPAVVWQTEISFLPNIKSTEFVDEAGQLVKSTMDLGIIKVMVLAADEALAKADFDPPELLRSTLIHPDRPLAGPRNLRRAVYRLAVEGNAAVKILSLGVQSATRQEDGTFELTVDLDRPIQSHNDRPGDVHLKATSMLNHEDERIRELVEQALAGRKRDGPGTAETFRRFVHKHLTEKNLNVGFASASEVARTRAGDCSEHAVLLAAMLRGAKIPSRTVSGLVYVDNFVGQNDIFGYHMWTQAWLGDGRWVDLDATMNTPFDATHITISVSTMDEGNIINDLIAITPMLGRLSINVVEP